MNKKTSLSQKISLMLLGLFLTIVILEIALRIGGLTILSLQEHRNLQSIKQKGACRILCLGESTTQNQYPPYLEEILNQRNIGINFSVIDKGISGTNTTAILSQLKTNLDKYQPDIVITMMGSNDGKGIMYYKDIPEANAWLFQHCRVYRFIRLIYMHIINKLKKEDIYGSDSLSLNRGFLEKEKAFKKAIELNPNNDSAYKELAKLYKNQGKFTEAEQAFKRAIELNPSNETAYIDLGWFYRDHSRFAEAEQLFNKAIELNPSNEAVYIDLGWLYKDQGKLNESEQVFKRAIELNPGNGAMYRDLGLLYRDRKKFTEVEQSFKKAIELNPVDDFAYRELGRLYGDQGKITEAEQLLKKAIEFNPGNGSLYGSLSTIYCEIGNDKLSELYAKKADSLRDEYSNPKTINNYHTLKHILDKRKVKLVCVQYPMRNIEPLKKIFREEVEGSIIFVDNERIFKDAVRKESYKEYFRDMFGGDFGHCTQKGNRFLAENIANTIFKEIFRK